MWFSVDPLAKERPSLSPYNYVQWNPLNRVDPDGMLDGDPPYVAGQLPQNKKYLDGHLSNKSRGSFWNPTGGSHLYNKNAPNPQGSARAGNPGDMIDVSNIPGAPGKFKNSKIPKDLYETAKFILNAAENAKNAKGIVDGIKSAVKENNKPKTTNNIERDNADDSWKNHPYDWIVTDGVDSIENVPTNNGNKNLYSGDTMRYDERTRNWE